MKELEKKFNLTRFLKSIVFLILIILIWPFFTANAFTSQVNYQGKLTNDSGEPLNGDYNLKFRICSDDACSTSLWEEERVNTDKVTIRNGLFSVMLGGVASLGNLDFNQVLYLETSVGGAGTIPDWEVLLPRKIIGSAPNAFNAQRLDGLATSSFLRSDLDNERATITSLTSTNFFATNASITNVTSTNFFTSVLNVISAIIDNLTVAIANITTLVFGSATGNDLTVSDLTVTSTANLNSLNATSSNLLNVTTTNLFSSNVNITGGLIASSTISGLIVSNFASSSISQWINDSGYLTSFTETDPLFMAASSSIAYLSGNNNFTGINSFNGISVFNDNLFVNNSTLGVNREFTEIVDIGLGNLLTSFFVGAESLFEESASSTILATSYFNNSFDSDYDLNILSGIISSIDNSGGGNINNLYHGLFSTVINNSGSVNELINIISNLILENSNIGDLFGIKININKSSSSSIDNLYGLYISEHTGANLDSFNLYSDGSNSLNYFGGNVGIGTTTPAHRLSIYSDNDTDYLLQVATSTNPSIFEIRNDGIARFGGDLIVSGIGTSTFAGNVSIAEGNTLQVSNIVAYSPLNINTDLVVSGNSTTTGNLIVSGNINASNLAVSNWNTAYTAINTSSTYWDTAYGWGDHALAGYLTSFTESDPIFSSSASFGIASEDITNWNTAYGWGNHATAGYLTTISGLNISLLTNDSGYLTTSTNLTIANFASPNISQWTNDSGYLTGNLFNQWLDTTSTVQFAELTVATTTFDYGIGELGGNVNLQVGKIDTGAVGSYPSLQASSDDTFWGDKALFLLDHLLMFGEDKDPAITWLTEGSLGVKAQYNSSTQSLAFSGGNGYSFDNDLTVNGGVYTQGGLSVMSTSSSNYFGGNVGIGTTTPAHRLSIYSDNDTDYLLQVATSTNSSIFEIRNDGIARFGGDLIVSGIGTSTFAGNVSIAEGSILQVSDIIAYSPLNINTDLVVSGNSTTTGNLIVSGNINASNLAVSNWNTAYTAINTSSTNWDTAYNWGNHSDAGYATLSANNTFTGTTTLATTNITKLNVLTGTNTSFESSEWSVNLGDFEGALPEDLILKASYLIGTSYSSLPEVLPIGKVLAVSDGLYILDESDRDEFEIVGLKKDLSNAIGIRMSLIDRSFEFNGHLLPDPEYYEDEEYFDIGSSTLKWNNLWLRGDANVGGSVFEGSDLALKNNINDLNYGLDEILGLRPVSFDYINSGKASIGFIAQEVREIMPELVHGKEGSYSLNYSVITSLLTKGIQQQQQQLEDLKVFVGFNDEKELPVAQSSGSENFNNLTVSQSATFYGTITIIGEAGFRSKVVFEDHVYFNEDMAGIATINAHATSTEVKFSKAYEVAPIITITPRKKMTGVSWWIENETEEGFVIAIDPTISEEVQFNWHAIAVKKSSLNESPINEPTNNKEEVENNEEANLEDEEVVEGGGNEVDNGEEVVEGGGNEVDNGEEVNSEEEVVENNNEPNSEEGASENNNNETNIEE